MADVDVPDPGFIVPTASVIQQRVTGIFLMGMVSYTNLYSFKRALQRSWRNKPSWFWSVAVIAATALQVQYILIVAISDMALRGLGHEERVTINGAMLVVGLVATTTTLFVRFVGLRGFVSRSAASAGMVGEAKEEIPLSPSLPATLSTTPESGRSVVYYLCSLASVVAIPFALVHVVLHILADTDTGPAFALALTLWRVRTLLETFLHLSLNAAFYTSMARYKASWTAWGITWRTYMGLSFQVFWAFLTISIAIAGFFLSPAEMVIDGYLIAIQPSVELMVFVLVNEPFVRVVKYGRESVSGRGGGGSGHLLVTAASHSGSASRTNVARASVMTKSSGLAHG